MWITNKVNLLIIEGAVFVHNALDWQMSLQPPFIIMELAVGVHVWSYVAFSVMNKKLSYLSIS